MSPAVPNICELAARELPVASDRALDAFHHSFAYPA